MYPYDTGVMRLEFKSADERLDERFRVAEPRMCADSLMRKVVDEWISRFNIQRMFSRFRLTKSDDHQMSSSNGRLFLSLSQPLSFPLSPSLFVSPFKPSRDWSKAHAVASSRTRPSLYNCNFSFRERDYIGVSSYAYVFLGTICAGYIFTFKCILHRYEKRILWNNQRISFQVKNKHLYFNYFCAYHRFAIFCLFSY